MSNTNDWIEGIRPKTLPAAASPVILGTCIAISQNKFAPIPALLCLATALFLQIACNFSNDYSDGIRGTDDERIGPKRLTANNKEMAKKVLKASILFYGLSAISGLTLILYTQIWILLLFGALSILASWFYTGGKHPYGYSGYGEISVFIFFGLIATLGTIYSQTNEISLVAIFASISMGMLACALLMINNIRDIELDKKSGKYTLATKLGIEKSKAAYATLIILPLVIGILFFVYSKAALLVGISAIWIFRALKITLESTNPRDLIIALKYTGQLEIIYAITLGIGIALKPITG